LLDGRGLASDVYAPFLLQKVALCIAHDSSAYRTQSSNEYCLRNPVQSKFNPAEYLIFNDVISSPMRERES